MNFLKNNYVNKKIIKNKALWIKFIFKTYLKTVHKTYFAKLFLKNISQTYFSFLFLKLENIVFSNNFFKLYLIIVPYFL